MSMIELFTASNVTSPFLKRSDHPAGNTLIAAPVSIKKLCFAFLSKSWRRGDFPVVWAAFTNRRSSFPVAVETYKVCGISRLSRQITRGTNKRQVGSETVVHALVVVTAMFSRSSVDQLLLRQFQNHPGAGVDKPVLEDFAPRPCCLPCRRAH